MSLLTLKKRVLRAAPLPFVLAFGLTTLGGDCDGDIVQDPTFRDWCGASLCAWHLEHGTIKPVPTWNQNDLGVSFVDTPTTISQVTTEAQATCLLFTSVADIDPAAQMTLSVDFDSDGSVEFTGPLGATHWQKVQQEITAPAAYQGITFTISKAGGGTAILAEMRIQSTSDCSAPPVSIDAGSLLLGEKCSDSTECASGLTCAPVYDGDTTDLLCSQCSPTQACPGDGGVACTTRSVFLPLQCGPGQGLGAAGAPCLAGSDCASGTCVDAAPVALTDEAGACDLDAALGDSNPSNCQWYAARGGHCQ
jgi:hypothetical protein